MSEVRQCASSLDASNALLERCSIPADSTVHSIAKEASRALRGDPDATKDIEQHVRISAWQHARRRSTKVTHTFLWRAARWAISNELRFRERWIVVGTPGVDRFEASHDDAVSLEMIETDSLAREDVARWLRALPKRLRAVYRGLYVLGKTQRQLASRLRISQPRVAQLHAELLRTGRTRLAHLIQS